MNNNSKLVWTDELDGQFNSKTPFGWDVDLQMCERDYSFHINLREEPESILLFSEDGFGDVEIAKAAAQRMSDSIASLLAERDEKWISVEDRAPEPRDQWLLCCGDGGEMCTIAWWKQPDGSYKFQHLNACEYPNLQASRVKYWMPLPDEPNSPEAPSLHKKGVA